MPKSKAHLWHMAKINAFGAFANVPLALSCPTFTSRSLMQKWERGEHRTSCCCLSGWNCSGSARDPCSPTTAPLTHFSHLLRNLVWEYSVHTAKKKKRNHRLFQNATKPKPQFPATTPISRTNLMYNRTRTTSLQTMDGVRILDGK